MEIGQQVVGIGSASAYNRGSVVFGKVRSLNLTSKKKTALLRRFSFGFFPGHCSRASQHVVFGVKGLQRSGMAACESYLRVERRT